VSRAAGVRQPGSPAPAQLILLLGAAGMAAGLVVDLRAGGIDSLAALCQSRAGDLLGTLRLHWHWLPWMHLGMIAGGLAGALPAGTTAGNRAHRPLARLARALACTAWMVLGMSAGTLLFAQLAGPGAQSAMALLAGMFGGMALGMLAGVACDRASTRLLPRLHWRRRVYGDPHGQH